MVEVGRMITNGVLAEVGVTVFVLVGAKVAVNAGASGADVVDGRAGTIEVGVGGNTTGVGVR